MFDNNEKCNYNDSCGDCDYYYWHPNLTCDALAATAKYSKLIKCSSEVCPILHPERIILIND